MNLTAIVQVLKATFISKGLSDADAAARANARLVDAAAVFRTSVTAEAQKTSPPNLHDCVQKAQADAISWAQTVDP